MSDQKLRKLSGGQTAHTSPDGFENEAAAVSVEILRWNNLAKVLLDCRDTLAFQTERMHMDGERLAIIERARKDLGPRIAEAMRGVDAAIDAREDVQRRRIEAARAINDQRDKSTDQGPIFEAAYAGVREMIEASKLENQRCNEVNQSPS